MRETCMLCSSNIRRADLLNLCGEHDLGKNAEDLI